MYRRPTHRLDFDSYYLRLEHIDVTVSALILPLFLSCRNTHQSLTLLSTRLTSIVFIVAGE